MGDQGDNIEKLLNVHFTILLDTKVNL